MQKHHEYSVAVAKFLSSHPSVEKVIHPLLPEHPQHELALRQNKGLHSGMVCFYVKGGEKAATDFLREMKVI